MEYLSSGFQSLEIFPKTFFLNRTSANWNGDIAGHIGINDAFFFVFKGECYLKIDKKSYIVKEGQLAFLPKGKMRTYTRISEEFSMYEVGFEAKIDGKNLFEHLKLTENNHVVTVKDIEKTADEFSCSAQSDENKNLLFDFSRCSKIINIINEYVSERCSIIEASTPFEKVIEYMVATPYSEMKLSVMSEMASMHPTYFIRKFKECFNVTPVKYFTMLKIHEAMSILSDGHIQISEVSKMIGIEDKTYFSKLFKKYTSKTPVEYRSIFKK